MMWKPYVLIEVVRAAQVTRENIVDVYDWIAQHPDCITVAIDKSNTYIKLRRVSEKNLLEINVSDYIFDYDGTIQVFDQQTAQERFK